MINLQFNEETKSLKSWPPQTPKKVFYCSSEMKHISSIMFRTMGTVFAQKMRESEGGGLNINAREMY